MIDRRQFVKRQTIACAALSGTILGTAHVIAQEDDKKPPAAEQQDSAKQKKTRPPRLDLDMVQEMVSVSHGKLERVKELVAEEPQLVNACHDWSAGDFETALGAAAHTGSRDIALFLLDNGARMDIFAAAMLGRMDIVKATLTAFPDFINTPGPHGIPLIKHAEYGKEPAAEVLEYLQSLQEG